MTLKKTFYPSKTFDAALAALVCLFIAKGWEFPGGALEQAAVDVDEQRAERAEHDALRSKYLALHETFGLRQEARYQRFLALLNAARGMFRGDKAVMAELDRFKRPRGRPRRANDETEAA